MKTIYRISLLLVLLAAFLVPASPAFAKGLAEDKVVLGGTYLLKSGQTLQGNLVIFGGASIIDKGATVNGDVALIGGSLQVSGTVNGDMAQIGGDLVLNGTVTGDVVLVGGSAHVNATAVVGGNLTTAGGTIDQSPGAQIQGQVQTAPYPGTNFIAPMLPALTLPAAQSGTSLLWSIFQLLAETFGLALLAALITLFLPNHSRRLAGAIAEQPLTAGGVGCLTLIIYVVAVIMIGLLTFTVILAPITIPLLSFGALAFFAALLFGVIGIGLEVGNRMARAFHTEWPIPLAAFLGTLLLGFVINLGFMVLGQLGWWLQCFIWWVPILLILVALGGVVMTRFGVQTPPAPIAPVSAPILPAEQPTVAAPIPPAPPASPAPSAAPPAPPPTEPTTAAEPGPEAEPAKPKGKKRSGSSE